MDDDTNLIPCPFCSSLNVERHYVRRDDDDWPGCRDCKQTRPLDKWMRLVAALRRS